MIVAEPTRSSTPDDTVGADLARAATAVAEAELTGGVDERYVRAHLAALRVAAVVLSVRPCRLAGRRPRDAWSLLAETAPELAEWAGFFAATQAKREAIENGARFLVTPREADDLVRDAAAFLGLVRRMVDTLAAGSGSPTARGGRRAGA